MTQHTMVKISLGALSGLGNGVRQAKALCATEWSVLRGRVGGWCGGLFGEESKCVGVPTWSMGQARQGLANVHPPPATAADAEACSQAGVSWHDRSLVI